MEPAIKIVIAVLAHSEERRIGACLASLPLGDPAASVHVVVNGSTDRTAAIARELEHERLIVHDWPEGGKARSWNRFLFDTPGVEGDVFVDGDAEVTPGRSRPWLPRSPPIPRSTPPPAGRKTAVGPRSTAPR